MDVERLFETLPDDDLVEEAQFVLNNRKVASKTELVDLITADDTQRQVAARILGVQSDDPDPRVRLLQALDSIEEQLRAEPTWIEERPEPEPVVRHNLDPVTVIRNGVQCELSGDLFRQQVEAASRQAVVWSPEETGVQFEPMWARDREAEEGRAFKSAYADDAAWPVTVTRKLWRRVVDTWLMVGAASDVMDPLLGGETEIPESAERAVTAMEDLAEALAQAGDGNVRTVARALARRIVNNGVFVSTGPGELPVEALSESIGWFLGVDLTYRWESEQPRAESMQPRVQGWVAKVAGAKGVWPSQAKAVEALVLHDASPYEARAIARAAYTAGR